MCRAVFVKSALITTLRYSAADLVNNAKRKKLNQVV